MYLTRGNNMFLQRNKKKMLIDFLRHNRYSTIKNIVVSFFISHLFEGHSNRRAI